MNMPVEAKSFSLVPASFEEAQKISSLLASSDLVPKDYKGKPANVMVAIAWGSELGLQPLQSLQNIAVINGRPAIWGDAALAVCMARADFEDIIEEIQGEGNNRSAICTVKRSGRSPVVRRFSVNDARTARLLDKEGPWKNYPDRMLAMRARGFALRDSFPDAMRGFHLAEEVQDYEEKDVTPAASRPAVVMPKATDQAPAADEQPTTTVIEGQIVDTSTGEVQGQADVLAEQKQAEPIAAPVEGAPVLSTGQLKVVRSTLERAGKAEADLAKAFGVDRIEAIASSSVNKALDWIKGAQ